MSGTISGREMARITLCLAVACGLAGIVLGIGYYVSEPVRIRQTAAREAATVRQLLDMGADDELVEVRRYMNADRIGYLLPDGLKIFDLSGRPISTIAVPNDLAGASAETKDAWATAQLPGGAFAGRFFSGTARGAPVGYVTEADQYGFKSRVRFLVALTPDFTVRGVAVVSHEEDPGLGAEIARAAFEDQFAGRTADAVRMLTVAKDPIPAARKAVVRDRATMSFAQWSRARATEIADAQDDPIYAVTGATISSRALAEGVQRAVAHLQYRIGVATGGTP